MFTARHVVPGSSDEIGSRWSQLFFGFAAAIVALLLINSDRVQAQATRTWASPGANADISNPANWGGTAPNFDAVPATSDSAIFSASTNAAVQLRNVTTGDNFANVTFDATAPAYTFSNPTNELRLLAGGVTSPLPAPLFSGGFITNNSAKTQNLTGIGALSLVGTAALADTTVNTGAWLVAANGDPVTKLSFDINQLKFNNFAAAVNAAGLARASTLDLSAGFNVRTSTFLGELNGATMSALLVQGNQTTGTGGTLFITGESNNTGRLVIGTGGVVRINHNNALGDPTLTTPTAANGNSQTVIVGGGGRNGRLELEGNITVAEGITMGAFQNSVAEFNGIRSPQILNVSGNNTLSGPFTFTTGGNAWTFAADAGTLTITSNLNMNAGGERYFTFQRAGEVVLNGNVSCTNTGATSAADIVKYDTGKVTFNGAANAKLGNFQIQEGTVALGASAGITFAAVAEDIDNDDPRNQLPISPELDAPRVTVYEPATFDVSAVPGGFNLTQTLQGKGTIKGTIKMASGARVRPGALFFNDGQGMSVVGTEEGIGKLTFQGTSGGGDYNNNGVVDSADYVVWRNGGAPDSGAAGYNLWRSNFGTTAGGGLDLSAGGIFQWQLGVTSTSNPGTDFDQIVISNGNLKLGGTSNVTLDFSLVGSPASGDPFWNSAHSWKIIDTTGNTGNTNFGGLTNSAFPLGHFTTTVGAGADVGDIFLNYVLGAGSGLGAGNVPEPTTLMTLLMATFAMSLVRRRS